MLTSLHGVFFVIRPTKQLFRFFLRTGFSLALGCCFVSLSQALAQSARAQESPFLINGLTIDELEDRASVRDNDGLEKPQPIHFEYRAAMAKFPTAQSCLPEQPEASVTSRLDWTVLDRTRELEVCVFRIAAKLGEPVVIFDWMVSNGFVYQREPFDENNLFSTRTLSNKPAERMDFFFENLKAGPQNLREYESAWSQFVIRKLEVLIKVTKPWKIEGVEVKGYAKFQF